LDMAALIGLPDSGESIDGFRGVTPWKVWNMPPCVGTGMEGAMLCCETDCCRDGGMVVWFSSGRWSSRPGCR
jgi:hypothetical protein